MKKQKLNNILVATLASRHETRPSASRDMINIAFHLNQSCGNTESASIAGYQQRGPAVPVEHVYVNAAVNKVKGNVLVTANSGSHECGSIVLVYGMYVCSRRQ
jgi:hypothetical protein